MIVHNPTDKKILTMTTDTWFNVNVDTLDIEYDNLLRFNIKNNAPNLLTTKQENPFNIESMIK